MSSADTSLVDSGGTWIQLDDDGQAVVVADNLELDHLQAAEEDGLVEAHGLLAEFSAAPFVSILEDGVVRVVLSRYWASLNDDLVAQFKRVFEDS